MVTSKTPAGVDLRHAAIRDAHAVYLVALRRWHEADTDARRDTLADSRARLDSALIDHGARAEKANVRRRADARRRLGVAVEHVNAALAELLAADKEARFLHDPFQYMPERRETVPA